MLSVTGPSVYLLFFRVPLTEPPSSVFPGCVYKNVQTSVLLPADGRRPLGLEGRGRPACFIQRLGGRAVPPGPQQRQHHGGGGGGGGSVGLRLGPGGDRFRHGVSPPTDLQRLVMVTSPLHDTTPPPPFPAAG